MEIIIIMLIDWGMVSYFIVKYFPPTGNKKDTGYEIDDIDESVYKVHKPRLNGKKLVK